MNDEHSNSGSQKRASLDQRLAARPELAQTLHVLIDEIEGLLAEGARADDVEDRMLERVRKVGQQALSDWTAQAQEQTSAQTPLQYPGAVKHAKKKLRWQTIFGPIQIQEQVWRLKRRGSLVRPFCLQHGLEPGGYSRKVRRAMVDFGAEASFAQAAQRMLEHHGVSVRAEQVRQQTYRKARTMAELAPATRLPSAVLVAQIDGSMIPILQPAQACADKRRARKIAWHELKACLARDSQSATPIYGATLGSVQVAGLLWRETAQRAGLTEQTRVHALGDGAPWILGQVQEQFGAQATYLVDFYHVSESLAAAAPPGKKAKTWLKKQQGHLLENKTGLVLRNLARRREPLEADERPVSKAHAYIEQRREQMNYAAARKNGLPIGSGEIESAHRHLVQARLKIPGAWKEQHAELMLGLRTGRANGLWEPSWASHLN